MPTSNRTFDLFPTGFCSDKFWDPDVTWNTANPDFTDCFQQTALIWLPCAFLWLMLPFQTNLTFNRRFRIHRWNRLSVAKMTLSVIFTILSTVEISFTAYVWNQSNGAMLSDAMFVAAVVKTVTFMLSVHYIFMNTRRARPSSAILFLFWFLVAIGICVTFRSKLKHGAGTNYDDKFNYIMIMFYFPLIILQFILSCFAEHFHVLTHGCEKSSPEGCASFPNRLMFWWITGLIYTGWKRALTMEDLWDLPEEDTSHLHAAKLEKYWNVELERAKLSKCVTPNCTKTPESSRNRKNPYHPSLTKALAKTFWVGILCSAGLRLISDLLVFTAPSLLKMLINFVSSKTEEPWKGILYTIAMCAGSFGQVFAMAHYFVVSLRTGTHMRSAVVAAIYRKALVMSNEAKRSSTAGEIVNLQAVDSQRFTDVVEFMQILWSAPLQIALSLYLLWQEMGVATLAGLGAMILLIPFNAFIAGRTKTLQISQMKEKDCRIKLMNEILNGMKILKLYAWEESFENRVLGIREKEIRTLRKAAYLNSLSSFVMQLSPFIVALVTFTAFVLIDPKNVLDAEKAFVSLSLFNILRRTLTFLSNDITATIQAYVAVQRISKFLLSDELNLNSIRELPHSDRESLLVTSGNFSWGKDEKPILQNINLTVKDSELVAVVGAVGAGKSSLCAAVLGLMEKISGEVAVKGKIAYVTQQAWIQNLTLKDNILFGKPYDAMRYEKVLDALALKPDLETLPAGDMTEIGEKGINLSGGQKQRVSLARAVYSGADVYFLDDPLSAVDAHVGKHIFENVIGKNGILQNKTRVLVTHGIGFLPQTDQIVVLNNGVISETGSYRQLLLNNGAFADFLRTYLSETIGDLEADDPENAAIKNEILEQIGGVQRMRSVSSASSTLSRVRRVLRQDSMQSGTSVSRSSPSDVHATPKAANAIPMVVKLDAPPKGQLVDVESSELGSVKWSVYISFLRQMSWSVVAGVFGSYILSNTASLGTNLWLTDWADDSKYPERRNSTAQRDFRLGIYGVLGTLQGIFLLTSALFLATCQILASRKQHEGMLKRIMRSPMSFFDTTPLGRIINRFSKDVDYVDTVIPQNFRMYLNCVFQVLFTVIIICITTPVFAIVVVPLGLVYYGIQRFFIPASRQMKRLDSTSRSPIYSHFGESIAGSNIIVAQRQIDRFVVENERLMDVNNKSHLPNLIANRWLAVRVELIGNCAVFFAGLFAVLFRDQDWGIDPKDIGLSISYALNVTHTLNLMVRVASELEANIVSVERIKEYSELPLEADWVLPNCRPEKNWPLEGCVAFNDYQTRYRPELDLILKGVSCDIASGEKVGIVGRTGAGKSSLTVALFRLIEAAGGSILIDGININDIGLHDLRSRLTIIPQEPVLFSGTLRLNLDPFEVYSDEQVWRALGNAHLRRFVSTLPNGLHHLIAEGGENLSVGQRQLICLARALLRKTKILILDEATAAIDLETDALIQSTIRDKFRDCTILTIAHRLNTIMDSTRIMVMDQGTVKEFSSPASLLNDKNSIFYGLAKSANLVK